MFQSNCIHAQCDLPGNLTPSPSIYLQPDFPVVLPKILPEIHFGILNFMS